MSKSIQTKIWSRWVTDIRTKKYIKNTCPQTNEYNIVFCFIKWIFLETFATVANLPLALGDTLHTEGYNIITLCLRENILLQCW